MLTAALLLVAASTTTAVDGAGDGGFSIPGILHYQLRIHRRLVMSSDFAYSSRWATSLNGGFLVGDTDESRRLP